MHKNEAEATAKRLNDMRKEHWDKFFAHKIPDIWSTLKPCDVLWCFDWRWLAMEFKFFNLKSDITREQIKKQSSRHQLITLESYKRAWWISQLVAYNKWTDKFYFYDY